jgi:putative ABC transport system permease protein
MNPLSPFTYYRRHKGWAVMLTALLALAVASVYLVIGLLQETFVTPVYTINGYLSKFSLVEPEPMETSEPALLERISADPDVASVLPEKSLEIIVPGLGGNSFPFRLIGLREADTAGVIDRSGITLTAGSLPRPGANEVALSREIATALGLEIGDTFDRTTDEAAFAGIVSPLVLTGILSGDVRLGIVSYEFLAGDVNYRSLARGGWLVFARPGRDAAVDGFLRDISGSSHTTAATFQLMREKTARDSIVLFTVGIPLVMLITIAITLVVGAINQLAFLRRLPEFGVLLAVGRSKRWLASRLTLETACLALAGWGLGILAACAAMGAISAAVYDPAGFGFDPFQIAELLIVLPLPLAVIGFTLFTAVRALGRLDPVAIVERGELSMEGDRMKKAPDIRTARTPRPLEPATFYRRHALQAAVLIGAMALMIVGTTLFVFVAEIFDNARQPLLNHLNRMSLVAPSALPLDAETIERIRAHPSVERTIPVYAFSALGIAIPPVTPNYPGETYAVSAEDMAYLEDLYGLELAEGHLPRAGTNEIVLPWTFARNRNLRLGDRIGSREDPAYTDAPVLPADLVVSGIFAPAGSYAKENWLSFVSLEYVEDNRGVWEGPLSLIVKPRSGQKAELDAWLEREIAGENQKVFTAGNQRALFQEQARTLILVLSLLEGVIALVGVLTLAGLNYIFVSGRNAEFGVLNALGFRRSYLVWRGVRENLLTSAAAWLAAVIGCAVILAGYQLLVYDPAGLRLNFFNPIPWLYTLIVPVAVLAAGAAAVFWILSRLDAVAIIERR